MTPAMVPPPRYATRPTPGAVHELDRLDAVARLTWGPLIPWQRTAGRIITEVNPSGTGWRWPLVIITVPRQCGKSVLVNELHAERAIYQPSYIGRMTAQTGKDARDLWTELDSAARGRATSTHRGPGLLPLIERVYRSAADSRIVFLNGSMIAPFPPSPEGLDGKQTDTLSIDEAMAHSLAEGTALMGSAGPTQTTRPWRQTLIISTAGHSGSEWFRDLVAQGRDSITHPESKMAYLEWSLDPASTLDPFTPEAWLTFHPGIGHVTDIAAIETFAETMPRGEFLRAYCNQWTSIAGQTVIPLTDYDALADDTDPLPADPSRVRLALDVADDDTAVTIAAAWVRDDGLPTVTIVERGAGSAWVPATLDRLAAAGMPAPIADPSGPTVTLIDTLAAAGHAIERTSGRFLAEASQGLISRTRTRAWRHATSPDLRSAIEAAGTRRAAGMTVLDPRTSAGPIDAARAAVLALNAAVTTHTREPQVF